MGKIKEQFLAWQSVNPKASKAQQRNKINELKRLAATEQAEPYTPEKNVQKAIAQAEASNDPNMARLLKEMQQGRLGQEATRQGVAGLPYEERYTGVLGQPLSAEAAKQREALYPRTMQSIQQGEQFPIASSLQDASSLPGRAIESGSQALMGNGDMLSRMGEVQTGQMASDIIRDPSLIPALASGSAIAGALPKAASPALKALGYAGVGAAEQAPLSTLEQMSRSEMGMGYDPSQIGMETAIASAVGPLGPAVSKGLIGAGELAKKGLASLSNKSVDLLETVGAKELKQGIKGLFSSKVAPDETLSKIKNYGEKAEEIVGEVVGYMDNFDELYKNENAVVNDAVQSMGNIDLTDVIGELNQLKIQALPIDMKSRSVPYGFRTGKKQIDDYLENVDDIIDDITGQSTTGKSTLVRPASDVLKLRRKIDETINFNKSNYSTQHAKRIDQIGKRARGKLKTKLEDAAAATGNPEYTSAMKTYSELLDVRDRINKNILGNDQNPDKVKNFLITLGNPDKLKNNQLGKDIQRILGKDLFEEAKLLRLSKEYRDGLNVFSDHMTGKANMATNMLEGTQKIAGAVASSPIGAAPLTGGISMLQEGLKSQAPRALRPAAVKQYGDNQ